MPRVLTVDNSDIKIGAYMLPDRKKPVLCKEEGNNLIIYGTFNSKESANSFMTALGKLVGAQMDEGSQK